MRRSIADIQTFVCPSRRVASLLFVLEGFIFVKSKIDTLLSSLRYIVNVEFMSQAGSCWVCRPFSPSFEAYVSIFSVALCGNDTFLLPLSFTRI